MEIRCPRCKTMIAIGERAAAFPCPSCGAPLEIVAGEAGFAIVGVDHETQQKMDEHPVEDSVLQHYTKWQEGAAYAWAAAAGLAIVLFNDVESSYLTYGIYFWKNQENLILIYIVGTLFILLLAGGSTVFFLASKRKRIYRKRLKEGQSSG